MMATEDQKEAEKKYAGLSNKELVLIYYRLNNYLITLNKNLEKGVITKQVETPMGVVSAIKSVPEKHVAKFRKSLYYTTLCETVEKLHATVAIIEECDDSIKDVLNQLK
jgi:hypothetical protein